MELYIFSDSDKIREIVKTSGKSSQFEAPAFMSRKSVEAVAHRMPAGTFAYIDVSGWESAEARRILWPLFRTGDVFWGLIDPEGSMTDVAELFHVGIVDYLGPQEVDEGLTNSRLGQVMQYLERMIPERIKELLQKGADDSYDEYGSANSWDDIVPGQEYPFYFMFIELDGKEEMEQMYDRRNLETALASFKKNIENTVTPFNGRLWIWSRFGGIVLFPLDPDSADPLQCGFRLMLFKHLYDVEGSMFPNIISFRTALHIGSTVYQEGNTGQIISDTLNSVFHLGQQYTKEGNFYITEDVRRMSADTLQDYLEEVGTFEGRNILRMRVPVFNAG